MIKPLILDIDSGNILSLKNIVVKFNENVKISNTDSDLEESTHILLPGVGSYSEVMNKIKNKINIDLLKKKLNEDKTLFLGICVGMQILSSLGYENETSEGLSLIGGKVQKLNTNENLPHVGWNSINFNNTNKIFKDISDKTDFYFTHSYCFELNDSSCEISSTNYGVKFSSAINKKNIYGTQFHPEKSQSAGIKLIKNFLEI
jgi:imidazole glycerol-phosphate synthase subunit HisH